MLALMKSPLRRIVALGSAVLAVGGFLAVLPSAMGAPVRVKDASPAEAAGSFSCLVGARGGMVAQTTCRLTQQSSKTDGGIGTAVKVNATAPTVDLELVFLGKPQLGVQQAWPGGTLLDARARVEQRVEWEGALSWAQGTFTVTITSVLTTRASNAESYELHGVVVAELPPANLPRGTAIPPVILTVSF